MPEQSSRAIWVGVGASVSVFVLFVAVVFIALQKFRRKLQAGKPLEGLRLIMKKSPYDASRQVPIPMQVNDRRDSVAEGMLAVLESTRRAKSFECVHQETELTSISLSPIQPVRRYSSTTSLDTINFDTEESPYGDISQKRCPYVEFTVLWASSNSSLTVYVLRLTSLPPKYNGCSCSLVVKLVRPTATETKTSTRLRKASLNPEYAEVFTFQDIEFELLEQCDLVFEVNARRSGHLWNKCIGDLHVPMDKVNLQPDVPTTAMEPLILRKKASSSALIGGRPISDTNWGEIQVLAQYQITDSWRGRIKIVIMKAQSTVVNTKSNGEYNVEVVMKRGEETVNVTNTKPASGPKPVWNAPFIYDVVQDKISEHWMELKLVRVFWTKKVTLGHAFLGLGTTPSGTEQWKSIIDKPGREVTLWHIVTLQG